MSDKMEEMSEKTHPASEPSHHQAPPIMRRTSITSMVNLRSTDRTRRSSLTNMSVQLPDRTRRSSLTSLPSGALPERTRRSSLTSLSSAQVIPERMRRSSVTSITSNGSMKSNGSGKSMYASMISLLWERYDQNWMNTYSISAVSGSRPHLPHSVFSEVVYSTS